MNILAAGETSRTSLLKQKLSSEHTLTVVDYARLPQANLADFDLIFDLHFDDNPDPDRYRQYKGKAVVISAVKIQLATLPALPNSQWIGLNALPTFLERDLAEVTLQDKTQDTTLKEIMAQLGWKYRLVDDRVGMVTPRLVYMIINEAFYTVQEGTASETDIDLGMKLGTNYPMGPFEWCARTGIHNVYEVLDAVYRDTRDERYKICPLLKTRYLHHQRVAH